MDTELLRVPWKNRVRWNVREDYSFIVPAALNPQADGYGNYWVHLNGGTMRLPTGGYFFDGDWLRVSELDEDDLLRETVEQANQIRANKDRFAPFKTLPPTFWIWNLPA